MLSTELHAWNTIISKIAAVLTSIYQMARMAEDREEWQDIMDQMQGRVTHSCQCLRSRSIDMPLLKYLCTVCCRIGKNCAPFSCYCKSLIWLIILKMFAFSFGIEIQYSTLLNLIILLCTLSTVLLQSRSENFVVWKIIRLENINSCCVLLLLK